MEIILKKIMLLVFSLVLILTLLPSASLAYTGGLANGQSFKYYSQSGAVLSDPNFPYLTDGVASSSSRANYNISEYFEYTFSSEKNLSDYQIQVDQPGATLSFYGSSNNLIATINPQVINGTKTAFNSVISGVKKIRLGTSVNAITVYEMDIFESNIVTPSIPVSLSATSGNSNIDLSWTASAGATSYNIKRSHTAGGPYTQIASSVTGNFSDTSVSNETTYFYVVTAVNSVGESGNSNETSATPIAPIINRALLVITLVNGLEKEYDLSMTEVNSFINWYNGRAGGTGLETYSFNKTFNLAKFLSRKDYIAFSKIETFEVNEYTP